MTGHALTLKALARELGVDMRGDPDTPIHGVATLMNARRGDLAFLANPAYRQHLKNTSAAAVIVDAEHADDSPVPVLVSDNPYAAYARIAAHFQRRFEMPPGVHESAVVSAEADVDAGACIGPTAVVEAGARIGAGAVVGSCCYVGHDAVIGEGCRLHPRVTILERVRLGRRVIVHSGAVIGSDGFGLALDEGRWLKVPQLGSVVIGDDCEIGANTTIDRGAIEDTILEEDVRLDNQIQIAHNVRIGAHTAMAGCSAVAGSATIGRYCLIGGGAGILGHLEIADRVTITAMSLVTHSIRESGEYSSGTPLQPNREWRRNAVRLRHLDEMARTINKLRKDR